MKAISCPKDPGASWQDNLGQAILEGSSLEAHRSGPREALPLFLPSGALLVGTLSPTRTLPERRASSECPSDVSVVSQEQQADPDAASRTCASFFHRVTGAWGQPTPTPGHLCHQL